MSLTVKEAGSPGSPTHLEVTAATARGYCIVSRDHGLRLQGASSYNPTETELWRFVEKGDTASLEQTRFELMIADKELRLRLWRGAARRQHGEGGDRRAAPRIASSRR